MDIPTLLVQIATGLAGAVAGFHAGRYERRRNAEKPPRRRWADIARVGVGVVILLLVVATQVQNTQARTASDRRDACYGRYFEAVSSALADRSAAQGAESAAQQAENDAQRVLLTAQGQGPAAIARYLAALDELQRKRTDLERVRAASPLPQPPECV